MAKPFRICTDVCRGKKEETLGGVIMKMTEAQKKLINTTPRMNFDTRMGISKMLKEEYGLQKLSELRKLYRELHPEWKLCEFVTNGEFLLTREGEVHQILGVIPNRGQLPEVIIVEDFLKITGLESYQTTKVM